MNIQEYGGRQLHSVSYSCTYQYFKTLCCKEVALVTDWRVSICTNCTVEMQVLRRACVRECEVPIPLTDVKKEWIRQIFLFFWVSISLLALSVIID